MTVPATRFGARTGEPKSNVRSNEQVPLHTDACAAGTPVASVIDNTAAPATIRLSTSPPPLSEGPSPSRREVRASLGFVTRRVTGWPDARITHGRPSSQRTDGSLAPSETLQVSGPWLTVSPRLTRRETDVLELAAAGLSSRDMSERLHVSEQAVTYHLGNLFAKFGADNRAGLIARAFVFGYLDPSGWPPRRTS